VIYMSNHSKAVSRMRTALTHLNSVHGATALMMQASHSYVECASRVPNASAIEMLQTFSVQELDALELRSMESDSCKAHFSMSMI
jgi:hypothetical protein